MTSCPWQAPIFEHLPSGKTVSRLILYLFCAILGHFSQEPQFLNLMKSNLSFMKFSFVLYQRNTYLTDIFSLKFHSFTFYIQVCDPFWINFICRYEVWIRVHFPYGYLIFPPLLLKRLSFLYSTALVKYQLSTSVWLICGLFVLFRLFVFMSIPCC